MIDRSKRTVEREQTNVQNDRTNERMCNRQANERSSECANVGRTNVHYTSERSIERMCKRSNERTYTIQTNVHYTNERTLYKRTYTIQTNECTLYKRRERTSERTNEQTETNERQWRSRFSAMPYSSRSRVGSGVCSPPPRRRALGQSCRLPGERPCVRPCKPL
jgi:hypothetical protein